MDEGVDPGALSDDDLLRELASLHDTRHDTLRHGSDSALDTAGNAHGASSLSFSSGPYHGTSR